MRVILYITVLVILSPLFSQGQSKLTLTGNIGLYADFYQMNADSFIAGRRPPELYSLICNPTLSYKGFSLPITINISPQNTSVVTPVTKYKNIGDYLQNPVNQVGIAPKYKWAQLLLGTQIPHYSELSFGDQPVFGAGVRLTPGKFHFEFFGGTSRVAIEEDTANRIIGAYKRKLYSCKIGIGKEENSHIYIIGGYAADDTSSLKTSPVYTSPANGIMSSIDFKVKFPGKVILKGEVAASLFSRDTRSKEVKDANVDIPGGIFTNRESTRSDGAAVLSLGKDWKPFGIKVSGRYIGDGFVPLGYPFMQTDRLEVTIDPRITLWKGKLNITGGAGEKVNNLSHSRGATATQFIGFANISAQLTDALNLSGNFSNFGMRNTVQNDSMRIQMVNMSYGFSPSYTFKIAQTLHLASLSLSHDQFRDFNIVSGRQNDNDANSGILIYNLAFTSNPFTATLTVSSFENKLDIGTMAVNSAGASFGYAVLKKKINLNIGETFSNATLDGKNPSTQMLTQLGIRWRITKALSFGLNASINTFKGGTANPNYNFTEDLLRTSLIYKL